MIDITKLMSPDALARIQENGLNKLAAAMLRNEGFKVSEELTLKDVVQALGTKVRQKNAEYARIRDGLAALKQLK